MKELVQTIGIAVLFFDQYISYPVVPLNNIAMNSVLALLRKLAEQPAMNDLLLDLKAVIFYIWSNGRYEGVWPSRTLRYHMIEMASILSTLNDEAKVISDFDDFCATVVTPTVTGRTLNKEDVADWSHITPCDADFSFNALEEWPEFFNVFYKLIGIGIVEEEEEEEEA